MEKNYFVNINEEISFRNKADFCIGTGRMGLALQKAYMEQLKLVQKEIGFSYIRGHGLFSDDMAIYQEYQDQDGTVRAEYNFTYLDLVMDNYLELGIRPFLELGFMPDKLASGGQTVFYWRGNVTPPKSYQGWAELVQATLRHLLERYGEEEVIGWPIEIWNEPNLGGFWENSDMQEYFKLFQISFQAIKEVNPAFRVGGPAICGVRDEEWMQSFMEFCRQEGLAIDFATRHHYCIDPPVMVGHYGYCELRDPDVSLSELHSSRMIVDSFPEYEGLEFHITEFNTSYSPVTPLHDTNVNAAYIAYMLSRLGEEYDSYSYWTFGDIFEEMGVPYTPFHGGFGLVANGLIPKPTFWTFQFYKQLRGKCILKSEDSVMIQQENVFKGVTWNLGMKSGAEKLCVSYELPVEKEGEFSLVMKYVDEEYCNPLKVWHDLGEPAGLTKEQTRLLQDAARPFICSERIKSKDGKLNIRMELARDAVVYFEVKEIKADGDRGYSYEQVMGIKG